MSNSKKVAPTNPPLPAQPANAAEIAPTTKANWFRRLRQWVAANKKVRLPLVSLVGILIVWGILWLTPARYPLANIVASANTSLMVVDSKTNTPVFGAKIEIDGKTSATDESGHAALNGIDFGKTKVSISKSAYETYEGEVTVGVGQKTLPNISLNPTGTSLALRIVNKLDGKPVEGVGASYESSSAASAKDGTLSLVIPPTDATQIKVKVSGTGYENSTSTIKLANQTEAQTITALPAGKIYFLSRRTGEIDVMKSNLDGSRPQTVLAGTGKEDEGDTVIFASRDWRYIALKAKRDTKQASIYLIDTANSDKLTVIDEGNAEFTPVGWYNHHFIYKVQRLKAKAGQDQTLKSYNADDGQIIALASSQRDAAKRYTSLDNFSILENQVVFTVVWNSSNGANLNNKLNSLRSVRPDGSGKSTIKNFKLNNNYSYITVRQYKAQELYIENYYFEGGKDKTTYYEYANAKLTENKEIEDDFNDAYPTYLISPDGTRSLWSENRDGKGNIFVGDKFGEEEKEIGRIKDFAAYGWFTDSYVLLSKDGSELYIMGADGGTSTGSKPIKITDYHKPDYGYYGYGYGYGGI